MIAQLLKKKQFGIQWSDATDEAKWCQFPACFEFVDDRAVKEEMFSSKALETISTASDVLATISDFFFKKSFVREESDLGVCTDVASAILGSGSGFMTLVKDKKSPISGTRCVIQRQALAAKMDCATRLLWQPKLSLL
jgi:hypothetical protein